MEYKILYKDLPRKTRGNENGPRNHPDTCFHECRHGGGDQGRGFDR